jgi:hypothetical protein
MREVRKLVAAGIGVLILVANPSAADAGGCGSGYYQNSRGVCVHRPVESNRAPSGASAKCRDGTWSFSQSRRGTCSHHGGVASWL